MAKTDANNALINTGSVFAPYQEFFYTIPAGSCQRVDYVTDNFALLEVSSVNALEINFGGAVNQTNFTAGLQYKLTEIVPYIQLFNRSNSPLTVHFALGVGGIRDNRLAVVGSINTTNTYTQMAVRRYVIPASGELELALTAEKVEIQNSGANDIFIGDTAGFLISPSGSMELPFSGTVKIFGTATNTVVVGGWSTLPIIMPEENTTSNRVTAVVEVSGGIKPSGGDMITFDNSEGN